MNRLQPYRNIAKIATAAAICGAGLLLVSLSSAQEPIEILQLQATITKISEGDTEEQRHTVRVRVPKEHAEALAARWGVKVEDAVRRAVKEAFEEFDRQREVRIR
jgi:hypothetical protein